jgi:Mg2+-importing ATPase
VVHRGVIEGRRTAVNINKYIMMGTSSNFGNMFSMAGASVFLHFLPMLPAQILLNNLLYDVSELAIPVDHVDADETAKPRRWDVGAIRRFMLIMGPVSSLFDFLTFFLLMTVLHANVALFRTGWFIESLLTQTLVIFVIRTRHAPWRSRPHGLLVVSCLSVIAVTLYLPYSRLGAWFGFVPPPLEYFALLAVLLTCYLVLVELTKRWYYRLASH